MLPGPVVTASWLAEHLDEVTVVDVRWRPGRPGRPLWEAGRIAGSTFVDLDTVLSDRSDLSRGRHPLPEPQGCADALAALGVGDRPVVAVDDLNGAVAARLWWMLRWLGGPECAVLEGGLADWTAAGGHLDTEPAGAVEPAAPWTAQPNGTMVASLDEVKAGVGVLLDARPRERFQGHNEHLDPRAGHVPGAVNAPWTDNLVHNRFAPGEVLQQRFARLGVQPGVEVVAMCGSGVTACHDLLALELAGLPGARLYVGSFSEWSRQDELEVVTDP